MIVKKIPLSFVQLVSTKKRIYILGITLSVLASAQQLLMHLHRNFMIFKNGTLNMWNGIEPYSNWPYPLDKFLYGPLFVIFFMPIAILPDYIGIFCWNILSFSVFFYAIDTMPDELFKTKSKKFIILYLLPILITAIHSCQYNVIVASLFLLSFNLLEKQKYKYALPLILLSGFTKIYGFFQCLTILFYPKIFKNILFSVLISIIYIVLMLIIIPLNKIIEYHQFWIIAIFNRHPDPTVNYNVFRLLKTIGFSAVNNYASVIQIISFVLIIIAISLSYKQYKIKAFRAKMLGVIMGWLMLFGNATELNTYLIALMGYLLWFVQSKRTLFDNILLWGVFIVLIIMPIDIIVPPVISIFFLSYLNLNLALFSIVWIRMCYDTFTPTSLC